MAKLTTLKPRLAPIETEKAIGIDTHKPKSRWGESRGHEWTKLRAKVLLRDKYTCQHCYRVGGKLECDHIINEAQGGTNDLSNLQTLCKECHKIKTSKEAKAGLYNHKLS